LIDEVYGSSVDVQWAEGIYKMWDVILRSGHHPRVRFENQNNLCRDLWWEMYLGMRPFFNIPEPEVFQYYRVK
jgi:hypothetical protein